MRNKCLIREKIKVYDAAFPLDSTTEVSPELTRIGVGTIVEVKGKRYKDQTRLVFYRAFNKNKYKHGGRRS